NGLIGGTSPAFQLKGIETEVSSCTTLQTSYSNVPNSTETPLQLCDILKHGLTEDEFNVSAKLVVPSDADVGQRNATLTFSAAQA
ncbi:hypothetical protein KY308_01790, partial [Candidatus Woesearchaeota archaeon]|nr:hypothetical protein [Candidatus Woesearchaeota archaeon]